MFTIKEQRQNPGKKKNLNEIEVNYLPDKEFKVTVINGNDLRTGNMNTVRISSKN